MSNDLPPKGRPMAGCAARATLPCRGPVWAAFSSRCLTRVAIASSDGRRRTPECEEEIPVGAAGSSTYWAEARHVTPEPAATFSSFL